MEPLHLIEYELTSEFATEAQRTLVRWDLRRGWPRDVPVFLCALALGAIIIWLGLTGWISPGVGGGMLCVVTLFALVAVYRRWSKARVASLMALLALGTSDRRVRIEFQEARVRLETEFFRGEAAWTELDEAVVFPGFWLLRFSNSGQIMLPAATVSPALESFIRDRAQEVLAPIHRA
jgi:hypothetical protein